MADKKLEIIIDLKDKFSKSIKNVQTSLKNTRTRVLKLKKSLFSLKSAFLGLGVSLLSIRMLNVASNFEKLNVSLTTILGSSKKAHEATKWISEFTAKTPYELSQVSDAFLKLSSYGFDATKHLEVLGDTASSMGKDLNMAVEALADAVTGEFERLKEFGIRARVEGEKVTFSWVENGITLRKTVKKTQDAITEGLTEIWSGKFSGGMDRLSKTWSGMWSNLLDTFTFFQRSIMNSGIFDFLSAGLQLALENIDKLKKEGKLTEWAQEVSDTILSVFESAALGTLEIYTVTKPLLESLLKAIRSIWEWFSKLPTWVQQSGLILAILGGPLGKLAAVAIGDLVTQTQKLSKTLIHTYKVTVDASYREAAKLEAKMAGLKQRIEELGGVFKEIEPPKSDEFGKEYDTTKEKIVGVIGKIKEMAAERKKAREESQKGDESDVQSEKVDLNLSKRKPQVSSLAASKSSVIRLQAFMKTTFLNIENLYKKGEISLQQYFARRLSIVEVQFNAEMKLLQKSAEAEDDIDKRLSIEDEIFQRREQYERTLIDLATEKVELEEELARKKRDTTDLMEDLEKRSEPSKTSGTYGIPGFLGMSSKFAEEMAELDNQHSEEIERLRTFTKDKETIDEAYRLQKLEKDKLLVDQEERLQNARLDVAQKVAGGLGDTFTNLYTLTGKKHKEFFILAKTAAIAETLIETYRSAQGSYAALAPIPYIGPALGIAAASAAIIAGMARVASIRAQSLAVGGLVRGYSPTEKADNIPIMATANEFVQPVSVVKYYGKSVMEAIRNKAIPKEVFKGFSLSQMPTMKPSLSYATGGLINSPKNTENNQDRDINITNIIDPRDIDRYMSSSAGSNAVLNIISSKARSIQKILRN